jgi:hypothetical protein
MSMFDFLDVNSVPDPSTAIPVDPSTVNPNYDNLSPSNTPSLIGINATQTPGTTDWSSLLSKLVSGLSTPAGALTGIAGLASLYDIFNNKLNTPQYRGWQGSINMGLKANRQQLPQDNTGRVPGSAGRQYFTPTTYAAQGGLMRMAGGGMPPRYVAGPTDGMADKVHTSIDGQQPAALSHGEFVVPADVVSHLGNGNSEAGANSLYKMMDRVRAARTGTTQQAKQINPEKMMGGGIAGYALGGPVAFDTGGLALTQPAGTTATSNLSEWAGPYVGDYLSKAQALSNTPYQAYTGPLTAGPSALQTQGFNAASQLPQTYNPTQFGNTYTAGAAYNPAQMTNAYTPPAGGAYNPTQFTNQFTAPGAYNPTQFNTGLGQLGSVQDYMSPYMSGVTQAAETEAARQAAIQSQMDNAKLAQAGAYGGSRQAILQSEGNRNLGTLQNTIYSTGLQNAYQNAQQQRLAESGLGLQAQQAGEASRQFGANQGMQGAQLGAQYGLAALQGNQANQQFGANLGQQQALANAQYGLAAQQGNQANQQFGANLGQQQALANAQYGLAGLQSGEAAKQFGANYGLQGLQSLLGAGATQRDITQQGVAADQAQWAAEQAYPYKQLQFQQSMMQGLPVGTNTVSAIPPTTASQLTSSVGGLSSLYGGLSNLYDRMNLYGFGGP